MSTSVPYSRRTDPIIPIGHPSYVWTRGADVQATWRKYGWVPPSERRQQMSEQNKGALQTSQL